MSLVLGSWINVENTPSTVQFEVHEERTPLLEIQ
jgi:hypothetical protein